MENLDVQIPTEKIPQSTTVLILGIASIPLCCFFFGLPSFLIGIVNLVLHSKATNAYKENPGKYTAGSLSNLKAGKICTIIGLIFGIIMILLSAWMISTFGWDVMNDQDALQKAMEEKFQPR
ncbi:MAG: CCC motif membrane protein [Flavobacteriales bacterium]|jgi:hypothetical protein